jgi:hypothetical protein
VVAGSAVAVDDHVPAVCDAAIGAGAPTAVVAKPPTASQFPAVGQDIDSSPGQSRDFVAAPAGRPMIVSELHVPDDSVAAANGCGAAAGLSFVDGGPTASHDVVDVQAIEE